MPPWDEGRRGVEQCCPLGFQPHSYHGSWVMAQGKGLARGLRPQPCGHTIFRWPFLDLS